MAPVSEGVVRTGDGVGIAVVIDDVSAVEDITLEGVTRMIVSTNVGVELAVVIDDVSVVEDITLEGVTRMIVSTNVGDGLVLIVEDACVEVGWLALEGVTRTTVVLNDAE